MSGGSEVGKVYVDWVLCSLLLAFLCRLPCCVSVYMVDCICGCLTRVILSGQLKCIYVVVCNRLCEAALFELSSSSARGPPFATLQQFLVVLAGCCLCMCRFVFYLIFKVHV